MHRPALSHSPRVVYGHTFRSHPLPAKPFSQKQRPLAFPVVASVVTLQIPWPLHLFGQPLLPQSEPTKPDGHTHTPLSSLFSSLVCAHSPPFLQVGSHKACLSTCVQSEPYHGEAPRQIFNFFPSTSAFAEGSQRPRGKLQSASLSHGLATNMLLRILAAV